MSVRKLLRGLFCGWLSLAFLFLGGLEAKVYPQASVNISNLDPVYHDIDKLVGNGLVDKIIMGQRPFSRKEIARITAEATYNLSRLKKKLEDPKISEKKKRSLQGRLEFVEEILLRLQHDYREELIQLGALQGEKSWYSLHPLEKTELDFLSTNSLPRTIPLNGLGVIDAVINPMVQYRQGRHLVDGSNASLETTHWFRATDHFAFFVQPRFQLAFGREGQADDNNAYILNLYSKFYVKNFEIEIGRDNLFWGQGLNSGLMLSNNPRGLDMIKISNDSPFFLPWVFRYIGALKWSFFISNLGPEQNFNDPFLFGYKFSFQPISFIEIGFSFAEQEGGDGSPPASLRQRVRDATPIWNWVGKGVEIGNKFSGVDLRFRVPPANGLELFAEIIFDDFYAPLTLSNLKRNLKTDTGYVAGFYLPRVDTEGKWDLRCEYHKTGIRYYMHGQYFSGWTLNKFILGDNLGPNAFGIYLTSNWDIDQKNLLTINGAFETRSADTYITTTDASFLQKVEDKPEERRYRATTQWLHRMEDWPLQLKVLVGYERVQNFNFVAGNGRNNYLGEIGLQFNFDKWTKFPK